MAIRKAGGTKQIKRTQRAPEQKPVEAQKPTAADVRATLDKYTAAGPGRSAWLSAAEAKDVIAQAKAGGPEVEAKIKADLSAKLKSGDIQLGAEALSDLSAFTGVDTGTVRELNRTQDKTTTQNLGEGLAKAATEVAVETAVQTKNQLDEYALQGKTGAAVSKKEFTPHAKAARAVSAELKKAGDAWMQDNAPEAKAAVDAVGPQVSDMVSKTADELVKDPKALERCANCIGMIGQEGFTEAVKAAGPDIGRAFTQATGVQAVNPDVVGPLLGALPKLADKVSPGSAAKVAETCAHVGSKLGVEVAQTAAKSAATTVAKEGAEAAVKAGAEAVGKAAAKEGTEALLKTGAKVAAKEGTEAAAKAGAKAAATSGKAVPGLGNLISVGSACLAAVGFVKSLFADPKDGESIAKEGLNTLLQTVGIAFPWVGLGGDLIDMGWSAKKAVTAQKNGEEYKPPISKQDAAGLIAGPARLLGTALTGAGHAGVAKQFEDLAKTTEKAASLKEVERHQLGAFQSLSNVAATELETVAANEQDPATKDALHTLAHGFGEMFKVLYGHKRLKGEDGPKREDLKAQLVRITGDCAVAGAALATGQTPAEITGAKGPGT